MNLGSLSGSLACCLRDHGQIHAIFLSIRMIINKMVIVALPDYLTGQSLGTNEAISKSVFLNTHS